MKAAQKTRGAKRWMGLSVLLAAALCLCACHQETPNEQFKLLTDTLAEKGHTATVTPLSDTGRSEAVPIYNETVWYSVMLEGGQELLVYFDTSNRAKQLAEQFCKEPEDGKVAALGLRYILLYRGEDEAMNALMDELNAI